tara:strand:+ start:3012 stop:3494 length:483 start_codon:yes stop_codon:yes gene_type:complete
MVVMRRVRCAHRIKKKKDAVLRWIINVTAITTGGTTVSMTKVQLPKIKDQDSGLMLLRDKWHAIYYVDGKSRRSCLSTEDIVEARILRDQLHITKLGEGATYKGGTKPAIQAAIDDPDGDSCIYEIKTFKVYVGGDYIGSSNNKNEARRIRNKYITSTIK